jgi:hypothetical protein
MYIFNFQILANDYFLPFFKFEFKAIIFISFWYYIDIKTQVNRNFTTSTFGGGGVLDKP